MNIVRVDVYNLSKVFCTCSSVTFFAILSNCAMSNVCEQIWRTRRTSPEIDETFRQIKSNASLSNNDDRSEPRRARTISFNCLNVYGWNITRFKPYIHKQKETTMCLF